MLDLVWATLQYQLSRGGVDGLPAVKELLSTMRARLEALNGPDADRVHAK